MLLTAAITFLTIALLCAPCYWIVLGRPKFLKDLACSDSKITISVIIPARNEEDNLPPLLNSLNQQTCPPHEVIVVDDDSQDQTAQVASNHGARVIKSEELPKGWLGKPWACTQGVKHATGDWLLFLDADTTLAPSALSRLQTSIGQDNKESVISVCPYHTIDQTYEEFSAFFNTLMVAGIGAFGMKNSPSLFGQCMLISKEHYHSVNGHDSVKGEVLENVKLAQLLKDKGINRKCYLGKGTVSMRMFPEGFGQLWKSWQKGFHQGAKLTSKRALIFSSIWISGAMFFTFATLLLMMSVILDSVPKFATSDLIRYWIILYALYAAQCFSIFRKIGSFSYINAAFFPVSLIFYQFLFFYSIILKQCRVTTDWKGRAVH